VQQTGVIPVKSERQAMDWSLVLVSQGIESTIEQVPESERWQLSVPSNDYARAVQALRQYKVENKRSTWVRELPAGLLLDWRALAWAFIMLAIYFVNAASGDAWQQAGLMNNQLVHAGEWWRLFTATTLHGDLSHLAINITTGFVLVGLAMGAYGPGLGLLATYFAGVGGNLAGLMVYSEPHQSLGASGIVMGALGAITVQSVGPTGRATRDIILRALCGGFLLLVLLGLSPDPRTDIIAHVGGFGSGALLGLGLALNRDRVRPTVDHVALGLFAVLIVTTWAFALG
jgi:rhomboid protease GluP